MRPCINEMSKTILTVLLKLYVNGHTQWLRCTQTYLYREGQVRVSVFCCLSEQILTHLWGKKLNDAQWERCVSSIRHKYRINHKPLIKYKRYLCDLVSRLSTEFWLLINISFTVRQNSVVWNLQYFSTMNSTICEKIKKYLIPHVKTFLKFCSLNYAHNFSKKLLSAPLI